MSATTAVNVKLLQSVLEYAICRSLEYHVTQAVHARGMPEQQTRLEQ